MTQEIFGNMALDLWKSNRTNHTTAYLYKQVNGSELKHEERPTSIFRVREIKDRDNNDINSGGFYKSSKDIIMLETSDKVNMSRNDYVKYLGNMYIVVDVKTRVDNQQMMVNNKNMSRKTTFMIRGTIK